MKNYLINFHFHSYFNNLNSLARIIPKFKIYLQKHLHFLQFFKKHLNDRVFIVIFYYSIFKNHLLFENED